MSIEDAQAEAYMRFEQNRELLQPPTILQINQLFDHWAELYEGDIVGNNELHTRLQQIHDIMDEELEDVIIHVPDDFD